MAARPDLAHTDGAPATRPRTLRGRRAQPTRIRSMPYRYVVADVFTRHAYGGNPLAVVLDAQGLDTAQMQRIAREFNSPRPASCCRRAIRRTRPRCGSSRPIGKCLSPGIPMSARRWCWRASWRRRDVRAGRVRVRRGGRAGADRAAARRADVNGAELQAPQPLSRRALAPVDAVARALRLAPGTSRRPSTRRKSCRSA